MFHHSEMRFWIWFPENFVQNAGWSPWMNWFAYEVGIRKGLYFFKVHRSQHPSLNSTNFPAWDGITIYILQITILKNILRVVKNPVTVREIIWREPCWPLPSIVSCAGSQDWTTSVGVAHISFRENWNLWHGLQIRCRKWWFVSILQKAW